MKPMRLVQVAFLVALAVSVVSCSTPMGASNEYYEEAPARANVYYGDPYFGGGSTILVERDPYTGRYYQVNPGAYGRVYRDPAYRYNNRRYNNNRYQNRVYTDRNYNANRNNGNRNNGYYRTYPQNQQRPQPRQVQPQRPQPNREQARDQILGRKKNS